MSEEQEFKYHMTCGHDSNDTEKCPYDCPESKVLVHGEGDTPVIPETVDTDEPEA